MTLSAHSMVGSMSQVGSAGARRCAPNDHALRSGLLPAIKDALVAIGRVGLSAGRPERLPLWAGSVVCWDRHNQQAAVRAAGPTDEKYELDSSGHADLSNVHGLLRRVIAGWRCSDARDRVYVVPFNARCPNCAGRSSPRPAFPGSPGSGSRFEARGTVRNWLQRATSTAMRRSTSRLVDDVCSRPTPTMASNDPAIGDARARCYPLLLCQAASVDGCGAAVDAS
jgi:hypothetical protein